MPFFANNDIRIHYQDEGECSGTTKPLLLIAPGGMRSAASYWLNTPWNPITQLSAGRRVIAMDQRNAGESTAPVSAEDGWHTYTGDQLALMDHLGIEQFHVAGMCIGGPYSLGLIQAAAQRVLSATLFQTIGRDDNRDAFYAMFDGWAEELKPRMPDVEASAWAGLRENMYGGDNVLFNVDEAFVSQCTTPLLVLMGDDLYHPQSASRMIAATAPNVSFVEAWKEGDAMLAAQHTFAEFLHSHDT